MIPIDFQAKRRSRPPLSEPVRYPDAAHALGVAMDFVLFGRPPSRRSAAEYLGARWEWGWTLFIWTSEAVVGPVWDTLTGPRGYVAQHLSHRELAGFLARAREIGGLLIDGDLEGTGEVIRTEPDQLIGRDEALNALTATR